MKFLPSGQERPFAFAILSVIAFKLWLVHGEAIVGSAGQHDTLWYLRSAAHWYWGRPYDWTAFIRPCAYPLWLAAVHLLHIPLRLAIELLQIGGALGLVAGLRSLGANRWATVLSFGVICLHPAGYQLNDYTASDTFYAAILWYVVGGLLLTCGTRRISIAAAAGIAIAVLWNTREEGLLLLGLVIVWVVIFFLQEKSRSASRQITSLVGTIVGAAVVVIVCVYAANNYVYRSFARSEMTASNFQGLFHSLLRIKPAQLKAYAPITTDTLHRAFDVSPTFGKLRRQFEGPIGEAWRIETYRQTGVTDEIGAGWIVWATRLAASDIGAFQTSRKATGFFRKAAREINDACDLGQLPTRFVIDGFLDPLAQSGGLTRLPNSAMRVGARIFARWPLETMKDDEVLTSDEAALYDRMTLRRPGAVPERNGVAPMIEHFIGRYHSAFIVLLHLAAAVSVVMLTWRRARRIPPAGYAIAIGLLATTVLLRLALFSWLDATAFDSTQARFLFPVLPLWSAVLCLTIGYAFDVLRAKPLQI